MSDDENNESEGLKVGDPVRWESAGEGRLRLIEERGGVKVGVVAPGGGWRWNETHAYFTMEDTGADGVPIRLEDLRAAEAPKTPEERLERIQVWTTRLHGIARDAMLAMEILKTETIGPGAHDAWIAYHGGDRTAAGDTVRSFRASVAEATKDAKTAAKAMKAVADAGEFIEESLAVAYQDLLIGQDRQIGLDEVEDGRHKESTAKAGGKRKSADRVPAEAPPTTAQAEPPRLIPWATLRAWGPSGPLPPDAEAPAEPSAPAGARIEGEALVAFLSAWRAGQQQLGCLVPFNLIDEEGKVPVLINFERVLVAADRVALVEQELVKRDGTGTETVERPVICTPELVDWSGFPGEEPAPAAPTQLTEVQRAKGLKWGLTAQQLDAIDAALRADPKISQVQLSKVTGVERTKIQRILKAGSEG